MAAVKNLCKTGIILDKGEMIYSGTADDAVNYYLFNKSESYDKHKIIENVKYNSEKIKIYEILINNSDNNDIVVDDDNNKLEIMIAGELFQDLKVSIEIKIYDQNEVPLMFYSPDLENNQIQVLKKGKFLLHRTFTLPKGMAKGEYFADIFITNPMIEGYADIYNAFKIFSQGHSTKNGFVFEYSKGHGWLFTY
ncbi:MAG TPA: hypothetical protein PK296_02190 [Paludibacteraceae bacterium]|nr:hypothetical protein [Paludibacteraceae bacterium]